jgi:hypothetical protein
MERTISTALTCSFVLWISNEFDCEHVTRVKVPQELEERERVKSLGREKFLLRIEKVSLDFVTLCKNVRKLSLVGHCVRSFDGLGALKSMVNLRNLKLKEVDGSGACPVCELEEYPRRVIEDICENRLKYMDGARVNGTRAFSRVLRKINEEEEAAIINKKSPALLRRRPGRSDVSSSSSLSSLSDLVPKHKIDTLNRILSSLDAIDASIDAKMNALRQKLLFKA